MSASRRASRKKAPRVTDRSAGGLTKPLPLDGWALDLARRWNSGAYTLFVLHGNIFDLHPVQEGDATDYVPLKSYLSRRIFPQRPFLFFFDIGDGLTFGSAAMQRRFFEWLEVYDQVERTSHRLTGLPHDFVQLAPILRRFCLSLADQPDRQGVTLVIDFPEKIIPAQDEAGASLGERMALVTLLKWAASAELRALDVGIVLVTEAVNELHADLLQNPHVAQIKLELPNREERERFIQGATLQRLSEGRAWSAWSDLTPAELGRRTAGLNLLRVQHLLAEAVRNGIRLTAAWVSTGKKRLIEEYCQGLVRFKDPRPGWSLDRVATHRAAKERLRELAWLIRNEKHDVLERGVLVPGRVGVGKSFLIDCFAAECGLPVMELGEFRSKWVGDTEIQQMRILMTIRALGPVIVVVDEADAVFGNRSADGDSGVSGRVFAAFAAHIGDSSLRGRELWVAMTSRPDLLAIDMKRQGRFGLCIPLFPAQGPDEVVELFQVIARAKGIALNDEILDELREHHGQRALTGSDVEAVLVRAKERAVLAGRDEAVALTDVRDAIEVFIDPLDPQLLALQELAAVLACSDRRYLPAQYADAPREKLVAEFNQLRLGLSRR